MNTMDCHQVREQLNAFLDHELGEFEQRQVAAHVEECLSCRHELEAYRSTRDFIHQFGPTPSPPNLSENIRIIMEKERLIPRRSKARSLFSASRFSNMGRFALAATFLLAVLSGGSYYIYDTIGGLSQHKVAAQKAAQTSAQAERQTPAATAAQEYARSLDKESSSAEPEMLSFEDFGDAGSEDADEFSDEAFAETLDAGTMDRAPKREADDTVLARNAPAPPRAASPAPEAPRESRPLAADPINSLDIMVEETVAYAGITGGPGSLPTLSHDDKAASTRALKPFSELDGLMEAASEQDREGEAGDSPSWTVAKRAETAHARSMPKAAQPAATAGASPTATSTLSGAVKANKRDSAAGKANEEQENKKDKTRLPALNIILKARSGQPHLQQQAMIKQLQPLLDSGAAQMQNGNVVLNMPADETLRLLQAINADPSNLAPVPVPEKMLQNEISSEQPRLVNTEIVFMADESEPEPPAAEADESDDESE